MVAYNISAQRMASVVSQSRQQLQIFRTKRRDAVTEFCGRNYSDNGTRRANLVNLQGHYTSIDTRPLMAKDPRVLISTFNQEARPLINSMKDWANKRIPKMKAGRILQRVALDALFTMGVTKVGITDPGAAAMSGYNRVAGEPFLAKIDLDDWVHDVHAACLEECSFMGHRIRVPFEVAKESSLFDKKMRKDLVPKDDDPYNHSGDERIKTIGASNLSNEELFDYVEMWEIYVPSAKRIYTFVDGFEEFFREQEWVGPDCGPYHILAFGDVPGNAMPKAPIMDLFDLHTLVNQIYLKLAQQSLDQKTVLGVMAGSDADAKRICDAPNGTAVRVDNPQNVKEMRFAGPDQPNWAMAESLKDTFSWLGGGLNTLGGLEAQTKTLGQEQLLSEGVSKTIAAMQEATIIHVSEVLHSLCWFWWHDPFTTMRSNFNLPGMELSVQREVQPIQRTMYPFDDLDIKIDPYSIAHDTPQSKSQKLMGIVERVIMPGVQIAMQNPNFMGFLSEYIRQVAQFENMPEIIELAAKLIPMSNVDQSSSPSQQQSPHMPANTSRTYNRVSGGSNPTQDNREMIRQMMEKAPSMNGEAA
jgi:hypothetical protein